MTQPKIEGVGHGKPRMLYASDGSNWYAILVDSDGHVKIDVVTAALPTDAATETTLALIKGYVDNLEILLAGGLPAALDTLALKVKEQSPLTGFATSANQATMITALQLIDDLRNALGSVNTDDLQVDIKTYPGSNALGNFPFGYYSRILQQTLNLNAGAGTNTLDGNTVPIGEAWVITAVTVRNVNLANTACEMGIYDGATFHRLRDDPMAVADTALEWYGHFYLEAGDNVRAILYSCGAGNDLYLEVNGYAMKIAS